MTIKNNINQDTKNLTRLFRDTAVEVGEEHTESPAYIRAFKDRLGQDFHVEVVGQNPAKFVVYATRWHYKKCRSCKGGVSHNPTAFGRTRKTPCKECKGTQRSRQPHDIEIEVPFPKHLEDIRPTTKVKLKF